jgi:hypothetical protein
MDAILKFFGFCCENQREKAKSILLALAVAYFVYSWLKPPKKSHGLTENAIKLLTNADKVDEDCKSICNALSSAKFVDDEKQVLKVAISSLLFFRLASYVVCGTNADHCKGKAPRV